MFGSSLDRKEEHSGERTKGKTIKAPEANGAIPRAENRSHITASVAKLIPEEKRYSHIPLPISTLAQPSFSAVILRSVVCCAKIWKRSLHLILYISPVTLLSLKLDDLHSSLRFHYKNAASGPFPQSTPSLKLEIEACFAQLAVSISTASITSLRLSNSNPTQAGKRTCGVRTPPGSL